MEESARLMLGTYRIPLLVHPTRGRLVFSNCAAYRVP